MKRVLGALLLLVGLLALRAQNAGDTAPVSRSPDDATSAPQATPPSVEAPKPAVPATGVPAPAVVANAGGKALIYVIPVRDEIAKPALYIIRRGVKEAIAAGARIVVLNMDTPGGGLGETLEIMEILDRFEGRVVTYVNREAGSAGAIIAAVTDDIYFAPKSVIGAAEVVLATGEDVGDSMKRKITSFLSAKVRALSEGNPMRGQVLQAMMDPAFEFKIGEVTIKAKDALLTLTATEAIKEYGDPPRPLFGAGIVDDLPGLYRTLTGGPDFEVREFQMTWSVRLAQWLTALSPLLLALGGLLLYIEFKTPGFGVFGVTGIICLLIVFFGHYVAGLSGYEAMLVFLLGAALVFVEIFLFPGTVVFALTGALLMLGSLLWGMADIWPGEAFEVTPGLFVQPLVNLSVGIALAGVGVVVLLRFLPEGWVWDRLVIKGVVGGTAQTAGAAPEARAEIDAIVGRRGVAMTALRPSGQVEVGGRRYEATCQFGAIDIGDTIVVRSRGQFGLIVEKANG
jgi:membrane-bound serine protease (ClpP class)